MFSPVFHDFITAHAQKQPLILLPVLNGPQIWLLVPEKHIHTRKFGLNCIFRRFSPFFCDFITGHAPSHINSTSGFKNGPQIGLLRTENIYTARNLALKTGILGLFAVFCDFITAHRAEAPLFYFRFQNGPQMLDSRTEKRIHARKFGLKTAILRAFRPFFCDFYHWRMRRNTIYSTSGFKIDLKFGFSCRKNIYVSNFMMQNNRPLLTPISRAHILPTSDNAPFGFSVALQISRLRFPPTV